MVSCREATDAPDGRWLQTAGIVLVRQKPGSAKGVLFLTIEDETGTANVVVWPKLYERCRRTILGASMLGINGKIQREGDVVHLVAQQLFDLSENLGSIGRIGDGRQGSHPAGKDADFTVRARDFK